MYLFVRLVEDFFLGGGGGGVVGASLVLLLLLRVCLICWFMGLFGYVMRFIEI